MPDDLLRAWRAAQQVGGTVWTEGGIREPLVVIAETGDGRKRLPTFPAAATGRRPPPAVPYPHRGLIFKHCPCGRRFLGDAGYRDHYRAEHAQKE